MITHLYIAGAILLLLALLHAFFPRQFGWHAELSCVSLLTRQIFFVHHFFIALTVGLMGLLTLSSAHELLAIPLGRRILLGFAAFWFLRLICQLFVYAPKLWLGKLFETTIQVAFTILWIYLSCVFFIGYRTGN
jgi:hypothetical protein